MTFERGDLLLIPFPFTDLSATKRRPVLALTAPDDYGDFIGVPVTSRLHHIEAVPISTDDLVSGALPTASWVRTNRVVSLDASLVVKSIARLAEPVVDQVVQRLCAYLGR